MDAFDDLTVRVGLTAAQSFELCRQAAMQCEALGLNDLAGQLREIARECAQLDVEQASRDEVQALSHNAVHVIRTAMHGMEACLVKNYSEVAASITNLRTLVTHWKRINVVAHEDTSPGVKPPSS